MDNVGIIPPSRLASFVLATTTKHAGAYLFSHTRGSHVLDAGLYKHKTRLTLSQMTSLDKFLVQLCLQQLVKGLIKKDSHVRLAIVFSTLHLKNKLN